MPAGSTSSARRCPCWAFPLFKTTRASRDPGAWASLNDRLLTAATAPGEPLPAAAPAELVRDLGVWLPEAKELATSLLPGGSAPWVWADPRLSFLVPFWSEALNVKPAVILVHRAPWALRTELTPGVAGAVATWDRYNRSALVLCGLYPSLVVSYDDLVSQGKETLSRVGTFLGSLGVPVAEDLGPAVVALDSRGSPPTTTTRRERRTTPRRSFRRIRRCTGSW